MIKVTDMNKIEMWRQLVVNVKCATFFSTLKRYVWLAHGWLALIILLWFCTV